MPRLGEKASKIIVQTRLILELSDHQKYQEILKALYWCVFDCLLISCKSHWFSPNYEYAILNLTTVFNSSAIKVLTKNGTWFYLPTLPNHIAHVGWLKVGLPVIWLVSPPKFLISFENLWSPLSLRLYWGLPPESSPSNFYWLKLNSL